VNRPSPPSSAVATPATKETEGTNFASARELLEKRGLPYEDATELPHSPLTFADGGHFRVEISGVERLSTLQALVDETTKRDLHVHRAVSFVAGATLLDQGELRAFAELAAEHGIEVIACPGPRAAWDLGRQAVTTEGKATGGRVRGSDNLRLLFEDYLRLFECGFRGILVWDEGVLDTLAKARDAGDIPSDTVMKVSVFTGHGNAAALRLVESLGADSVNPVGDLSRPMLAAIRSVLTIPLDVYAFVYDSFGGINRYWETGELARVAAPCYFKIEPGENEKGVYTAWADPAWLDARVRDRVRHAAIMHELAARTTPTVKASPPPS
jgi:hypothetical protein